MKKDENICPHCETDLRDKPIPKEHQHLYGTSTHFSRKIGIEIRGVYDGMLFWQCPNCGGRWHRFTDEYMRKKAEPYIDIASFT